KTYVEVIAMNAASQISDRPRRPSETVELDRSVFGCPIWCVTPLAEHISRLDDGGALHTSTDYMAGRSTPVALDRFDGNDGMRDAVIVRVGGDELDVEQARSLARALLSAT